MIGKDKMSCKTKISITCKLEELHISEFDVSASILIISAAKIIELNHPILTGDLITIGKDDYPVNHNGRVYENKIYDFYASLPQQSFFISNLASHNQEKFISFLKMLKANGYNLEIKRYSKDFETINIQTIKNLISEMQENEESK